LAEHSGHHETGAGRPTKSFRFVQRGLPGDTFLFRDAGLLLLSTLPNFQPYRHGSE
jgi:hypothetical protein